MIQSNEDLPDPRADRAQYTGVGQRPMEAEAGEEAMTWTHIGGDAGRTRYADDAPVDSLPRAVWAIPAPQDWVNVLASPTGIVIATPRTGKIAVIEPETGSVRYELYGIPWQAPIIAHESVVLVHRSRLCLHDLATGRLRFAVPLKAQPWTFCALGDELLVGTGTVVRGLRIRDAEATELWGVDLGEGLARHGGPRLLATPERVYVEGLSRTIALERGSSEPLWTLPGAQLVRSRGELVVLDSGGVVRWADGRASEFSPSARYEVLAPGNMVAVYVSPLQFRDEDAITIDLLDLATGVTVSLWQGYSVSFPVLAMVRDVLYVATDYNGLGIGAIGQDGAARWGFSEGLLYHSIRHLVPLDRRLLVVTDKTILCLA